LCNTDEMEDMVEYMVGMFDDDDVEEIEEG
jgi:hypothetical protein